MKLNTELRNKINNAKTPEEVEAIVKAEEERKASEITGKSAFNPIEARKEPEDMSMDDRGSLAYRKAFRDYLMQDLEGRAVSTSSVASVIPTTIAQLITETEPQIGLVLAKITKTNLKAGVEYPVADILDVKASFVNEGASSTDQTLTTSKIQFTQHKIRCSISLTKEVAEMSLPEFEQAVAQRIVKAMDSAVENAIFNGNGTGTFTGIANTTGVKKLDYEASYDFLYDMLLGVKQKYRTKGVWYMTSETFYEIQKIKDTNGQPIARVNTGIDQGIPSTLLGHPVVELDDYIKSSTDTTAVAGDPFIYFGDMSRYVVNTIYETRFASREKWEDEAYQMKAVCAKDGKLLDADAFVIAKKSAEAARSV